MRWAPPLLIYVLASGIYVLLGSLQDVPVIAPDEFLYGHVARSLADGDGLSFYGVDQQLRTALYVYLIAPAWLLASGESAYEIAKVGGALMACSVVFPVWVLARRMMPPARAALPVVLSVAGTWMLSVAGLMTENLAYPLGTAALVCCVLALRDDDGHWAWAAFAFATAATFARAQMAVLFLVFLAAILLDAAFADDIRARLRRRRIPAGVLGAIVAAGGLILIAGSASLLGPYSEVSEFSPPLGRLLSKTGEQWLGLAILSGVLPLAALIAVGAKQRNWRDRDLGPLLCVAAPAVLLLLLESGFFNAGVGDNGLPWSIERYVQYAVPLLLVLLFTALERDRLGPAALALAGVAVALTFALTPEIRQAFEERAQFAVSDLAGTDPWIALTLAGLLIVALAALALRRLGRSRAVLAIGALLLLALLLQSQGMWRWQIDLTDQVRAQYPESLSWVDDNARGPVTRMYIFQNSALFQTADVFNKDIEQVLTPSLEVPGRPPLGPNCPWVVDARGVMQVEEACGPVRSTIWNDDPLVLMSFHGGRIVARDANLGQIIAVPPEPRLRSIVRVPCQRATLTLRRDGSPAGIPRDLPCPPHMSMNLWVDSPGTLEMTFQGGRREQRIRHGKRTWRLAPSQRTTIRVPITAPASSLAFGTDWTRSDGTPRLVDAAFVSGGTREPLI